MIRYLICVTALTMVLANPADAQQRQAARTSNSGGNAFEIGKAGAWGIFTAGEGRARTCFIMAQPAERLPKGLSRDPAHIYISMRQGEASKQEFAVITGYPVKQGADAQVAVGAVTFTGTGQNKNIWLKNPAEEGRFIGELRKGSSLTVKGTSQKGNDTTDRYLLTGFGQALERAQKECS
ncbi:MAG: invasion associated locus B family protein [Beijerinckiaceae bacterium]